MFTWCGLCSWGLPSFMAASTSGHILGWGSASLDAPAQLWAHLLLQQVLWDSRAALAGARGEQRALGPTDQGASRAPES